MCFVSVATGGAICELAQAVTFPPAVRWNARVPWGSYGTSIMPLACLSREENTKTADEAWPCMPPHLYERGGRGIACTRWCVLMCAQSSLVRLRYTAGYRSGAYPNTVHCTDPAAPLGAVVGDVECSHARRRSYCPAASHSEIAMRARAALAVAPKRSH